MTGSPPARWAGRTRDDDDPSRAPDVGGSRAGPRLTEGAVVATTDQIIIDQPFERIERDNGDGDKARIRGDFR
jgi:hypothetical protein